jgi:hypothetical protein
MTIKPKNSELNQIVMQGVDHFIATILSFPFSFLVIFYFSLKYEGRYHNNYLTFLLENFSIYVYLCSGITLIANIIVYLNNRKNYSIREFIFFDKKDVFTIRYKRGYSNSNCYSEVSENTVNFYRINETGFLGETNRIVNIFSNGNKIFSLNLDDYVWSSDKVTIGKLLNIINKFKTAPTTG